MRRMVPFVCVVAAGVLLAGPTVWGGILYVDDDAAAPGDGASWATAYRYLQDALTAAAAADEPVEIHVAQGTYKPDRSTTYPEGTGDRDATFRLFHQLMLLGGYAGLGASDPNARDFDAYATVLSGDLAGNDIAFANPLDAGGAPTRQDNCYHVISGDEYAVAMEDFTAILEGLIVTGGHAFYKVDPGGPTYKSPREHLGGGLHLLHPNTPHTIEVGLQHCVFEENYAEEAGGGAYALRMDDLTLVDCEFLANGSRGYGGGLFVMSGYTQLIGCRFDQNASDSQGGGVRAQQDDTTLSNCTLTNNTASLRGGGVASSLGPTKLIDCVLQGNRTEIDGGAISVLSFGPLEVEGCRFVANEAGRSGGAIQATALDASSIEHCLFSSNAAQEGDAVQSVSCRRLCIQSSTVVGNKGTKGTSLQDGTRTAGYGSMEVRDCIISNGDYGIWADKGEVTLRYTNLVGGKAAIYDPSGMVTWGEGNIDADPLFVDPGYWDANGTPDDPNDDVFVEGDYHLKSQAGRWDEASGGWVQDDVTSPCIDAGDPNDPIGDEPFPNGGIINMGAYGGTAEASKSYFGQPVCATVVAGDINGDCTVDWADLTILLRHWLQTGTLESE